ncbi:MAG: hypothetical protein AAF892_01810 [Cyanobacteria bacterium P01_D01_bin.71]
MFPRYSALKEARLIFTKGFRKISKNQAVPSNKADFQSDLPEGQFTLQNFGVFGFSALLTMSVVGGLNWVVDPLWFGRGNKITPQNFDFPDERIVKTNLFLNTKDAEQYDCLILGSSRTNALRPSAFENENCFNYSFKSGHIEEFSDYAEFVKRQGINPKTVYVGVDEFNFLEEFDYQSKRIEEIATESAFSAYFVNGALVFSIKTVLGMSPNDATYYDENFEMQVIDNPRIYNPSLDEPVPDSFVACDLSKVQLYKELREQFPDATVVAYVPPRSAWKVVSETYEPGFLDCVLEGFYEIAQSYDAFYDFSIPSEMTADPQYTYDGSHYYPEITDQIAGFLQGNPLRFGIEVSDISFDEYLRRYKLSIDTFLKQDGDE